MVRFTAFTLSLIMLSCSEINSDVVRADIESYFAEMYNYKNENDSRYKIFNRISSAVMNDSVIVFSSIANQSIFKLNYLNNTLLKLGDYGKDYVAPNYLHLNDTVLYYNDISNTKLKSISLNGTPLTSGSLSDKFESFLPLQDKVYFLKQSRSKYYLYDGGVTDSNGLVPKEANFINGSNPQVVLTGLHKQMNDIYFMNPFNMNVYKFNTIDKSVVINQLKPFKNEVQFKENMNRNNVFKTFYNQDYHNIRYFRTSGYDIVLYKNKDLYSLYIESDSGKWFIDCYEYELLSCKGTQFLFLKHSGSRYLELVISKFKLT